MPATTSIKLPDELKEAIAKVAALEGKTAHALMVDTLQTAISEALLRHQFYVDGEKSYQDTLRTNVVFAGADVKAYIMSRTKGNHPDRPAGQPLHD